jgi:hypothetical protein
MPNEALDEAQLAAAHMPPDTIADAIRELRELAPIGFCPELSLYNDAVYRYHQLKEANAAEVALVLRVDFLEDIVGRSQDRVRS